MMRVSNNPKGRPPKDGELRKAVSYRLTPKAINAIKAEADKRRCSQSDVVMSLAEILFVSRTTEPPDLSRCERCPSEPICYTTPDRCGMR